MTFAYRLKELRKERGLTQAELADALQISRSAIGMYERGDREPNFDTADNLAEFFNVSLSYLLGSIDVREPYPDHQEPVELQTLRLSAYEAQLLRAFRGASPEIQRIVKTALNV